MKQTRIHHCFIRQIPKSTNVGPLQIRVRKKMLKTKACLYLTYCKHFLTTCNYTNIVIFLYLYYYLSPSLSYPSISILTKGYVLPWMSIHYLVTFTNQYYRGNGTTACMKCIHNIFDIYIYIFKNSLFPTLKGIRLQSLSEDVSASMSSIHKLVPFSTSPDFLAGSSKL